MGCSHIVRIRKAKTFSHLFDIFRLRELDAITSAHNFHTNETAWFPKSLILYLAVRSRTNDSMSEGSPDSCKSSAYCRTRKDGYLGLLDVYRQTSECVGIT